MADISRNTTPAWQDPHLKDRGDYTEQDIQNIQEKGGILPDFTLDEAEETHLFARVAQALSKTLTRQGLAVRHEAKAAAEPMGYRLDEHAIAIDTRRPWKDIALDLAHALGAIQVARDAVFSQVGVSCWGWCRFVGLVVDSITTNHGEGLPVARDRLLRRHAGRLDDRHEPERRAGQRHAHRRLLHAQGRREADHPQ